MPQHPQQTRNLPRVRRHTNVGAPIASEHVVEHLLAADVLVGGRLCVQRGPVGVVLWEALFKFVRGEVGLDVRLCAAAIAGVRGDALTEVFLDCGDERPCLWQGQAGEGEARGVEAAEEGAGVVRLRRGDFLLCEELLPELVDVLGLDDAFGGEVRIGPGYGGVAVFLGPVAVPGGCAEVGFCRVVVAFAVTSEEEQSVAFVVLRLEVETLNVAIQPLPGGRLL